MALGDQKRGEPAASRRGRLGDHRHPPGYPYITAPIAAAETQRSKPQVYEAIQQLQTAGVLASAGKAGRAAVYEADGLLALLAALERGDLAEET